MIWLTNPRWESIHRFGVVKKQMEIDYSKFIAWFILHGISNDLTDDDINLTTI